MHFGAETWTIEIFWLKRGLPLVDPELPFVMAFTSSSTAVDWAGGLMALNGAGVAGAANDWACKKWQLKLIIFWTRIHKKNF